MGKFLTFVLICTVIGCSAEYYRNDADLQVDKLLSDRKQTTLGYTPKTVVSTEDVAPPTRLSYTKIPVSPVPPPAAPVLEPMQFELQFEPLGPPTGDALDDTPVGSFQTEDIARESLQRLKLGPPAAGAQAVVQLDLFKAIQYAVQH